MTIEIERKLFNFLESAHIISDDDLRAAYEESQKTQEPFDEILVRKSLISDIDLGKIMSDLLEVRFVTLARTAIEDRVLKIIPEVVARKQKIITFGRDAEGLKVAMANPANKEIIEFLAKKTGEKIVVYLATKTDIDEALNLYKKDFKLEESGSITDTVDKLLLHAFDNHASDVHIEPEKEISRVRFRIDGVLHDIVNLPLALHEQVVSRIKVAAKLQTDEHLSAQDGKMELTINSDNLDIRVSIVPIVHGEKIVLRLLSAKLKQFTLEDLGMEENDLAKVRLAFTKPFGMLLSTGPTGSGKTTTIYAVLKILNTPEVNIATIEDPIEYDIQGINQIQVNVKTNLTFADGLRSILRQDPNIIFVGEIRDAETAKIAVNSATTGHLVLSTLHTNDAATTLPRLADMGVEPYLVATTVNVIIGQRLVRKICEKCRVSRMVTRMELLKQFPTVILDKLNGDRGEVSVYQGKGCPVCHQTGYVGRIGIFEVLEVNEALREMIVAKEPAAKIKQKAVELGMTPMMEDGFAKVLRGLTTIEEILRATRE